MFKKTSNIIVLGCIATGLLFIAVASAASLSDQDQQLSGKLRQRRDETDLDNKLYSYDTIWNAQENSRFRKQITNNLVRNPFSVNDWAKVPSASVVESSGSDVVPSGSETSEEKTPEPDMDKLKAIAFNGREVKLVGPNQKEVEVKNDLGTKVLIALDNLQKEATEVFEEVGDKLEKGWVDLRKMLAPKNGNSN